MKKGIIFVLLWVVVAMISQPVLAESLNQDSTASGSMGDPADMYLDFTITGANFTEVSPGKYEGYYNGSAITLSGKGIVTRGTTVSSWVSLDANIMDQVFHYPPEGADGYVTGKTETIPYNLTFTIPADYPHDNVNGHVRLDVCGEWNCSPYDVKFVVWLPDGPITPLETDTPKSGLPIGFVAGGVAAVVVGGTILALGGFGALSLIKRQGKPKASPRSQPVTGNPEVDRAVQAWEQIAWQAELEAQKYIRQWGKIRASSDPSDPGYQALMQQYKDYIDYKRKEGQEARQKIQNILQEEQQYQQEKRQQEIYRQSRQAEGKFIEHESQRQARRETDFDRSVKQAVNNARDLTTTNPHEEALARFKESMEAIDKTLKAQGVYVRNLYQGIPVIDGVSQAVNVAQDLVLKGVFNIPSEAVTCQDYVDRTIDHVRQAVELHFPGAKVESILFQERSSMEPEANIKNWFDSFSEENHNLMKVTLPNGMEYAVDFHQHNAHMLDANRPPIVRPWNGAVSDWRNSLGAHEFVEELRTV